MRDVTLLEVHQDGEHLVLSDASGEQFRLAIDDQLRAAVRRDVAWLNRLRLDGQQDLRPRDIQARIRAGMSAEELAEVSGMPLEHVRRYEGPVLAEREHVADGARRVTVARTGRVDTSLEDAVRERLAARDAADHVEWDAWREENGTWIVQSTFSAGGRARSAQWRYLIVDATLEPVDDEARWLTALPEEQTTPGVRERVFDVEADGAVRETTEHRPRLQATPGGATLADPQERTLDLLDALRGRRGRRVPMNPGEDEQTDLVDALLEAQDEAIPPAASHPDPEDSYVPQPPQAGGATPPEPGPEVAVTGTRSRAAHPAQDDDRPGEGAGSSGRDRGQDRRHGSVVSLPEPAATDPADSPPQGEEPEKGRGQARSRRPSVPKWDDIMFGTRRD